MAYNIGQRVRVVDADKCYTTYYDWLSENGISLHDNDKIRRLWSTYLFHDDTTCENGDILTIVAMGCHGNDRCLTVYLCEDCYGNPVLINELGLNPIEEKPALKWSDLEVGDVIRMKVTGTSGGYRVGMVTIIDTFDTNRHVRAADMWLSDEDLANWEKVDND